MRRRNNLFKYILKKYNNNLKVFCLSIYTIEYEKSAQLTSNVDAVLSD